MRPKTTYLALCVIGTILPYWQFVPWAAQHGLSLPLFFRELFANRISAFFGIDVIVSAIVLIYFARVEGSRIGLRRWWFAVIAVLTVGVSLGLPLFLYLRELKIEQNEMMSVRCSYSCAALCALIALQL
jgi:hypothetical protein